MRKAFYLLFLLVDEYDFFILFHMIIKLKKREKNWNWCFEFPPADGKNPRRDFYSASDWSAVRGSAVERSEHSRSINRTAAEAAFTFAFNSLNPTLTTALLLYISEFTMVQSPTKTKNVSVQLNSRSAKARLKFRLGRITRHLTKINGGRRVERGASVYLVGVILFLMTEIVRLAGNVARDDKKLLISTRHLNMVRRNNEELNQLLSGLTSSQGQDGIISFVYPDAVLLPKETAVE